ncbi:unnamed protein product [Colias eurytheme]|nr:unnamed protein product [Colias eurytheme]
MYPTDNLKHGLKINPFIKENMLKTIQNLCYNNSNANNFNMTSPFLVDNILHQQKSVNFHNQYLNQQLENYVLQRNFERSRENSPEVDETKMAENDEEIRNDEATDKNEDDDSKSNEDESFIKNEAVYYNHEYYRNEDREKEVLNIPSLRHRCHCGSYDCPPYACKKSGIRRLEELEKRFNLHNYQDNSGDEDVRDKTEDMVKNCDDYNEPKKPLLKFSVSAILGEERDTAKSSVNGELITV